MEHQSTDKLDTLNFEAHGRVEFAMMERGVLVYRAFGPFNRELVEAVAELEARAFPDLKAQLGQWVEIVLFEDNCLLSDDALDDYSVFLKESNEQGAAPIASAFVYEPGVEGAEKTSTMFQKVYDEAGIEHRHFKSFEEARDWVIPIYRNRH